MGGKCCEKKRVQTFLGLCLFSGLEKDMLGIVLFFTTFPSHTWDSELKCSDSSLRHFLLCTGDRV